jgi:uncharacterized OB-fold protein
MTATGTDQTTGLTPPGPSPDADSAPYWAGLREHRLRVQACGGCGRRRFPPVPACPYCAHPESRWEEATGRGVLYSAIVVHRTLDPQFADEVPYTVGTADLEGGGRLLARVEGEVELDAPVRPLFVDHPGWTELRFTAG